LTAYEDDDELLDKVRTGKGDEKIYPMFVNIYVEQMFGETIPKDIKQDFIMGDNDLRSAKATLYTYFIDLDRFDAKDAWFEEFEYEIQKATEEFNSNPDLLNNF